MQSDRDRASIASATVDRIIVPICFRGRDIAALLDLTENPGLQGKCEPIRRTMRSSIPYRDVYPRMQPCDYFLH